MPSRKHTTPTQLDFSFTEAEIWRPVVGYEGLYEVSNLGRVRSLDILLIFENRVPHAQKSHLERLRHGRILKGNNHLRSKAYIQVYLCKDGTTNLQNVHTLVLSAFIGPRPHGYVANHIDSNRKNNRVSNLEWVTPRQNNLHAVQSGKHHIGAQHPDAKLTEQQVREIRQQAGEGVSFAALGRQYGVDYTNISQIVRRRTWKHVP